MKIFTAADMMRHAATGLLQLFDMFEIAMMSEIGAGIRFKIIVNVKNTGDGLRHK